MEIWIRLIQGQNLKLRCRGFAMFFCGDAVFVILFRSVAVWTVPQCPPHYYTINPYGTVIHNFLHVIYKPKKKTNLLCILNNVFQYSKIRTRKRNAKKSKKKKKNWNPALFRIRNPVLGIRNPQGGIQNPRLSWIPLHGASILHQNLFPLTALVQSNTPTFTLYLRITRFLLNRVFISKIKGSLYE